MKIELATFAELQQAAAEQKPRFTIPMSEKEARRQAQVLKALSDPTRLQILSLLARHSDTVRVADIVSVFPLEQPTISHHLRTLRTAGLEVYYYVVPTVLAQAQKMIGNL